MYRLKTEDWYLERIIYLMAGIMTLLSVVLILLHSIYWLILTALVGINLLVFSFTGFCPMAVAFHKMGAKPRLGT